MSAARPHWHPGPQNLITDVGGVLVGNAEDHGAITGTTAILFDTPMPAAIDQRGGAPGTRETDLLRPDCLVDGVDAIILSGGSAFGLAAADGAMQALVHKKRGYEVGDFRIPIVPAAILMDLTNGGDKQWGDTPPYAHLGRLAVEGAGQQFSMGNAGAGLGAKCGGLKGGLGSASVTDGTITIGALVAVNAFGHAVIPGTTTLYAWQVEMAGEMGHQTPPQTPLPMHADLPQRHAVAGGNTTLALVAISAGLSKGQCQRLAMMAQDGLARSLRPIHTPFDGDTVFAVATGGMEATATDLAVWGTLAADTLARAVGRAMVAAKGIPGYGAYADLT